MPWAMATSRSTVARSGCEGAAAVRGAAGPVTVCAPVMASAISAIGTTVDTVRMRAQQNTKARRRMFRPEDTMIARSIGGFVVATAVLAALMASPSAQRGGGGPQAPDDAPTPRMGDGHPDLNGWWGGGGGFAGGRTLADLTDEKGNVYLQLNARSQGSALGTTSGQLAENFERDSGVAQRAAPNKPI